MFQTNQQEQDYSRRHGTNLIHGPNFEHQMMAYLAVTCCNEKDIKDWWMASNVNDAGVFDDIVLFIDHGNSRTQLNLIQLKHKENPNKKQDEEKKLEKNKKKKKKKDPLLVELKDKKYFESFQQIRELVSKAHPQPSSESTASLLSNTRVAIKNMQFVFVTNAGLRVKIAPLKEVKNPEHSVIPKPVKKVQNSYLFATNPDGQAYQLDPDQTENPDEKKFRSQFVILTEQISANSDDLLQKIASEMKTYFNSNNNFKKYFTVAKELTDEIEKWFKENSKKLTFHHFKEIISKLILFKFVPTTVILSVLDREYNKLQDCQFVLWKKITSPFQLVVFDNENYGKKNFFDGTNSHLFIKCEDNCIDVVIKCLEIDKQQKVVLKKSINSLSPFQQLLNEYEIQTFTCLSNLFKPNLIGLIGECSLWLQGRELSLKSLLRLDPNVANVLDVDDVISLISKTLYIGDKLKQLPYYVLRSIQRIFLKKSVIVEKQNLYFIIIVDANCYKECVAKVDNVIKNAYTQSTVETKQVNFLSITNNGINQAMLNVNEKYKSVHVLSFHEYKSEFLFEWVTSIKNVSEIKSFIDNEKYDIAPIRQNEMDLVLNCSDKVLLVGNPGMGKSFYLRFLANKYSTDSWILFITLNELDYTKINTFQACLDDCVSKMSNKSREIFDIYLKKESVVVLFDGFDEIAPYYEHEGLKIIKGASEMRLKIVVTSRFVKKNVLEKNLDILSRTLKPFSDKDKTLFLKNYYSQVRNINILNANDLSQEVKQFVDQLVSNISLSSWDADFTGVPLQCQLIAESFVDEFVEYCRTGNLKLPNKLNLLSLYERFIYNKFNIFWREKEDQPEKTSSQKALKIQEFDSFMQNHIKAAVHIIFPSLNKKIPEEYLKSIGKGDEKRGIITGVDSNDNPIFIHRTFAEYFAAKWLVDIKKAGSEEERTKYLKNLLSPEHNVVRDLFDRLVCRDCELHTAVLNADKEEVLRLLEQDRGIGEGRCGRSALHLLSARGATHECGKDLEEIIRREEESHFELLDILLSCGVCDAGKDQVLAWTAQQYAESRKAFGVIDTLIKYNQFNKSESVLLPKSKLDMHVNVILERKEIFQDEDKLLEMCCKYDYVNLAANVMDLKSVKRETVEDWLKRCAEFDSVKFAEKLIQSRELTSRDLEAIKCEYKYGSGESSEGSILHLAAINDSRAVVELLLGYFQVDTRDREGRTALFCAIEERRFSAVQLLISRGADPFAEDKVGQTPMYWAIIYGLNSELMEFMTSFEILKAAYGYDVNALLGGQIVQTALLWATGAENWESVQQLVTAGADPNVKDIYGRTALHYACGEGNVEIVRLLSHAGAELDVQDDEGETALHRAALWGNKETAEVLVQSGVNTDILDDQQRSALTVAREYKEKEVFLYLWPHTSHHTTDDIQYHTELTDVSSE